MVGRVLVSQNGSIAYFKVSKPTYEVTTTVDSQNLLFDISSDTPYIGTFSSGTILHSAFTDDGNVNAPFTVDILRRYSYTLNYGKTFANPPTIVVKVLNSGLSQNIPFIYNRTSSTSLICDVVTINRGTTSATITKWTRNGTLGTLGTLWDINYIICQR